MRRRLPLCGLALVLGGCPPPKTPDSQQPDSQQPDSEETCVVPLTITGALESFRQPATLHALSVEVHLDDSLEQPAEVEVDPDVDGVFTFEVSSCSPALVAVPAVGDWVGTVQPHMVWSRDDEPSLLTYMMDVDTKLMLHALLRVQHDSTKGFLYGQIVDADGQGVAGRTVRTPDGEAFYFTNSLVDEDATSTSADGRFFVLNATPGEVTVAVDDGDAELANVSTLVVADEMTQLVVTEGQFGVPMPAECDCPE